MGQKVSCVKWLALQQLRLISAAAVLLVITSGLCGQTAPLDAVALLREWWVKMGSCRPLMARLSGQPFSAEENKPCWQGKSEAQLMEIVRLESRLETAHRHSNSPQTASALAIAEAAKNRIEEAIQSLEATFSPSPSSSARVLSDLSALYLHRAIQSGSMTDYWRALSNAERALRADKTHREAAFNLALILEAVHLHQSALEAWKDYRKLDPDSDWSQDAQQRIDRLAEFQLDRSNLRNQIGKVLKAKNGQKLQTIVERFPSTSLAYGREALLGGWADRWLAGSAEEAERLLESAQILASELTESGEPSLGDSLQRAGLLSSKQSSGSKSLALGYQVFRDAQLAYRQSGCSDAVAKFQAAEELLTQQDQGTALLARFYAIRCGDFQESRYEEAFSAFHHLRSALEPDRQPDLKGLTEWMMGLTRFLQGNRAAGIHFYSQLLETSRQSRNPERTATAHNLLSVALSAIGDNESAHFHLHEAMKRIGHLSRLPDLTRILEGAARILLQEGEHLAALHYHGEFLAVVQAWGNPLAIADAYLWRAKTHMQGEEEDQAFADLRQVEAVSKEIKDPSDRLNVVADLRKTEGLFVLPANPGKSVKLLTEALDYYLSKGNVFRVVDILADRANASRQMGELDKAESDLKRAIGRLEEERPQISESRWRVSAYDLAKKVFEQLTQLKIDQGDMESAWLYSEMSRSRSLLDALGQEKDGKYQPPSVGRISSALPADTLLAMYALLDEKLVIWLLSRDGLRQLPVQSSAKELRRLITEFRKAVARRSGHKELESALSRLFQLLIAPLQPHLSPGHHLVIVPEKELFHLSFAALLDPRSQRFLLEDHPLSYAPSASVYLQSLLRSRAQARPKGLRALLIGNPLIERRMFPSLPRLPGSEEEVRAIAEFYPSGRRTVLSGRRATKAALLAALPESEVVHLSTHALVNQADPDSSAILFAPENSEDGAGILLASEIRERQLEKVRLVILAACRTASGTVSVSEGVASLARPFLAAGVPAVVGAWWDVEDRAASRLLRSFHRRFAAGLSSAEALRQAQLESLARERGQPYPRLDWAVFGLIGASTGEELNAKSENP